MLTIDWHIGKNKESYEIEGSFYEFMEIKILMGLHIFQIWQEIKRKLIVGFARQSKSINLPMHLYRQVMKRG